MFRLNTIIASTRPNRVGAPVGRWFHEYAQQHGTFDAHLIDLAELDLPMFDEPMHPRLRDYRHEHTKRWSRIVDAADAFVLVTPEYNFAPPASLLNAMSYLFAEWHYKPLGFVSYGGVSGGLRSVQMIKLPATALKMMPLPEAVAIPMVANHLNDGIFTANDLHRQSASGMLNELQRWTKALAPMRQPAVA